MSDEDVQPIQYPGLNEAVAAAVAQALANAGTLAPMAAPPAPALYMTSTPILGLKQPAMDDQALITDLNDNMTILDSAVTATVPAVLTNKTLIAPVISNPTITGWTNAQHNHLDAAGAGTLDGASITSGYLGTGNLLRESVFSGGGVIVTTPVLLDPTVRDTLFFAPEPTGAADATIQRVGVAALRFERMFGVGVTPSPDWRPEYRVIQIGATGAVAGATQGGVWLSENTVHGPTGSYKSIQAGPAAYLSIAAGVLSLYAAMPGTAGPGVSQGFARQFSIVPGAAADSAGHMLMSSAGSPQPWGLTYASIEFGQSGGLWATTNTVGSTLGDNTYRDATGYRAKTGVGGGSHLTQYNGTFSFNNAPVNNTGDPHTFKERLLIAANGTVSVTPDAGAQALVTTTNSPLAITLASGGGIQWNEATNNYYARLQSSVSNHLEFSGTQAGASFRPLAAFHLAASLGTAANAWSNTYSQVVTGLNGYLELHGGSSGNVHINCPAGVMHPKVDNTTTCGHPSYRWSGAYFSIAPVIGSSADLKRDVAPLDPALCAAAVLETDWVSFTYLPPTFQEPEVPADKAYDASDSNEVKAEKKSARDDGEKQAKAAHAKLLVETAPSRDQKGYVLQHETLKVADLFGLSDRQSASTHADLAVVACALQSAFQRIQALEAQVAGAA